ncbi:MAG: GNAT family N-acetyltransferase [Armatimonadetes bacterium]|nr:GNAT family N-acetyltransferase [Armatimonadota bacterium]MDE2205495.1 GNAT family N-acetyltransferase [Armatimonadota bacterium]
MNAPSATIRAYRKKRDRDAARRIWMEVGWSQDPSGLGTDADMVVEAGRAVVAEMDGSAEALACSCRGAMQYLDSELPIACVTGVAVSRIARKQGLARRLTAQLVAHDAREGAALTVLGMFEQGFYNELGFGTGAYEVWASFNPADLQLPVSHRPPQRIACDEQKAVHACRLARRRSHGGTNLHPVGISGGWMNNPATTFGLGFRDPGSGAITHMAWFSTDDNAEFGPLFIPFMAWRTPTEFLELMSVIRSLGDRIHLVRMPEPAGIQLQDLLSQPFARFRTTAGGKFAARLEARGYWQARINHLEPCVSKTQVCGEPIRFNLKLSDPIEKYLAAGSTSKWRGCAGEYVITFGPESSAHRGTAPGLPVMQAEVGAFTRLWLGVQPATGLAITDKLKAPDRLLEGLDRLLRLPRPCPDWDF